MAVELVKGTNVYLDDALAASNAYFEARLNRESWAAATELARKQALISATAEFDNLSWSGYAVDPLQTLAFPRVGSYFDSRTGTIVEYPEDSAPTRVINGVYELAYHYLNSIEVLDSEDSITGLTIGPIKLEGIKGKQKIPSAIMATVRPLLVNSGATMWWRAN